MRRNVIWSLSLLRANFAMTSDCCYYCCNSCCCCCC